MSWRGAAIWVAVFAMLVAVADILLADDLKPDAKTITAPAATTLTHPRDARVLRVVDGDTIVVKNDAGRVERVRYIGVDTPESVKPNTPVQCFGHEASDYNRSLVQGREVRLVPDREPRDAYGRSLAFVYVGGTLINAELLKNGYARTLEIAPNTSKAEYFAGLERVAIRTNKGLWRACDR